MSDVTQRIEQIQEDAGEGLPFISRDSFNWLCRLALAQENFIEASQLSTQSTSELWDELEAARRDHA